MSDSERLTGLKKLFEKVFEFLHEERKAPQHNHTRINALEDRLADIAGQIMMLERQQLQADLH